MTMMKILLATINMTMLTLMMMIFVNGDDDVDDDFVNDDFVNHNDDDFC